MSALIVPERTVEDAAVDLILGAKYLLQQRERADRTAAALEARWEANRATRRASGQR